MIDTHTHINFSDFDTDRDEIIRRAFSSGVSKIINIGIDIDSSLASLELAEKYDRVYAVVGVHPHDSEKLDRPTREHLQRLAQHPKVVAIGETGLDYYRKYAPHDVQRVVFGHQLALSRECGMPVVVHVREAMEDALKILAKSRVREIGGVLHCFSGTAEDAARAAQMNLMVSFGGSLTFKNSRTASVAAKVPLEQIILETDAPFITPEPHRGSRNEPSYIRYTYQALADLKGLPVEQLEKTVDDNARRLFDLS